MSENERDTIYRKLANKIVRLTNYIKELENSFDEIHENSYCSLIEKIRAKDAEIEMLLAKNNSLMIQLSKIKHIQSDKEMKEIK